MFVSPFPTCPRCRGDHDNFAGHIGPPNPPVQEGGVTVRGPSWDRVRGWPVPEGRLDKAHAVRGIHALTSVDPLPLCTEDFPFVIICEHKQVIQCITAGCFGNSTVPARIIRSSHDGY